jgi:hypothetical protein
MLVPVACAACGDDLCQKKQVKQKKKKKYILAASTLARTFCFTNKIDPTAALVGHFVIRR